MEDGHIISTTKSVNFYQVEIIELPIVLGDSPSVSTGGPPMSVDWIPMRRTKFSIDIYEEEFGKRRRTKTTSKSKRGLIISGAGRTNFFLRCGYSMGEIEEATEISQRFKREMTISKIFNNDYARSPATTTDRFVTNTEKKKMKNKKKRCSTKGTTLQRSWSDSIGHASNPRRQLLVPPQRISSPSSSDKMFRKNIERNKSLPIDIEKMMTTNRRLPPTIPSRKQSPIRGRQQVSTTTDVPGCFPTNSQPNSRGELPTRNKSMPVKRRNETPQVRPTRDISPSNACRKKNAEQHQLPPIRPSRSSSPFSSSRKGPRQTTTDSSSQLPPIQPKRQGDARIVSMNATPTCIGRNQSMPVVPRHHLTTQRSSSPPEEDENEGILLTRSPPSRASSPTMAAITDNFSPKSPGLQMPMRKLSPPIPATRKSFSVVSAVGLSLIPPQPPSSSSTTITAEAAAATTMMLLSPPPPSLSSSSSSSSLSGSNSITSPVIPLRNRSPVLENQKTIRRCT